jgi:hypothetical protein
MNEVRLPNRLIKSCLSGKKMKLLRFIAFAKLQGHRSEIKSLLSDLKIEPKTGKRLIQKAVSEGLAGSDGKFFFPRSWKKLGLNKKAGLYLTNKYNFRKLIIFEALCFAMALKNLIRKGSRHANKRSVQQDGFPTGFLCKALELRERRFKTLKANAQRYRFISVKPQFKKVGKASDFNALKKNSHGIPVFLSGKNCIVPSASKIKVLI